MDKQLQTAVELLSELVDDDPCWFDHSGNCQAHGLSDDCPHQRAKDFIKEMTDGKEETETT